MTRIHAPLIVAALSLTACADDTTSSSTDSGGAGAASAGGASGGTSGGGTSGGGTSGGGTSSGGQGPGGSGASATTGGGAGTSAALDAGTDASEPCEISVSGTPKGGVLELSGQNLVDEFGTNYIFDETTMVQASSYGSTEYFVSRVDNGKGLVFGQTGCDAGFNAGGWFAMEWLTEGGDLYFCQSTFDGSSEDEARAAARADRGDLATGCGGFGWSKLTAPSDAGVDANQ